MAVLKELMRPFADISVVGLQADDAACGHYRIAYPLRLLQEGGAKIKICTSFNPSVLNDYDVVIAQRQYSKYMYEALMDAKFRGKTVLFEIDDNVHVIHPNSVAFTVYKPGSELLHSLTKFLKSSDGLFTSSPELASQYSVYCKRTWVIPNSIDFGIRDWDTPVERDERLKGKIVIGWAGSITHQDDWAPLQGVIRPVLEKYPEAIFALVSAYKTMDIFCDNLDIPKDRLVRLDPVDFDTYPQIPTQFDIGLCPLVNTTFNRAKSYLKCLEYGARNVPYVATKIAPYVRIHAETEGQGGYVCSTQQEWIEAISRLVEDKQERRDKAEFMNTFVRENYNLRKNVHLWANAIREARNVATYNPESERVYSIKEKPGRNEICPCGSGSKYKKCHYPAWG